MTIAASTLSLAGCSDFLDTPVLGQQDLSEYFVNEDQCKQQITGCYQSIFWDDWWQIQKFYLCGDMCTDDMWIGNTGEDQELMKIWHFYRRCIWWRRMLSEFLAVSLQGYIAV